jgi:hypothetical protein
MPGLPFIVVSGTISEEIAVQTIRLGASDYVTKANLGRLGSAIARELAAIALARPRPGDSWKRATPPDSTFPLDRYNQYLRLLTEAGGIGASRSSTQPPYLCILVHADGWAGSARLASIC